MFEIILVTCVLECLVFMPISFTVFRFFLAPDIAFVLSISLCLISILACWLYRLKLKVFVYRIISVAVSILFAYVVAQFSIVAIFIAAFCIFIFMRAKTGLDSGLDLAIYLCATALFFNIALALITFNSTIITRAGYSNATILISTIGSIILLTLKQMDDSRKFGKNNMDINSTQRKNNKIFAVASVVLLLAISSIGQVSNIYRFVINAFLKLFKIISYILSPGSGFSHPSARQAENTVVDVEPEDVSIFHQILDMIIKVITVIIIAVLIGFAVYLIGKMIIKLIRKIINWFKNGEQKVQRYYENGHVDEKQSLYNRNISNMAKKLRRIAGGLFDRELPYHKLPNNIEKTRRLFKYFQNNALQAGVQISKSSTAEEICQGVSAKAPETKQLDDLMSKCYDAARYGETAPSLQELLELENKLLK